MNLRSAKNWLVLLTILLPFGCRGLKIDEVFLFPENSAGAFLIVHDQPGGEDPVIDSGKRIYSFLENRILYVKNSLDPYFYRPYYYYVTENGEHIAVSEVPRCNDCFRIIGHSAGTFQVSQFSERFNIETIVIGYQGESADTKVRDVFDAFKKEIERRSNSKEEINGKLEL